MRWWRRAWAALQFVPRILARLLASDGSTHTSPLVRSLSRRILQIARSHPVCWCLAAEGSIVGRLVETPRLLQAGCRRLEGCRRDYIACLLGRVIRNTHWVSSSAVQDCMMLVVEGLKLDE